MERTDGLMRLTVFARYLAWLRAIGLASLLSLTATASRAQESTDSYADLVTRVMPSVVNISVRKTVPVSDVSPSDEKTEPARTRTATFIGSGFIIDPEGFIVTNRHVVIDSYSITVGLSDGTRLAARVVGHPPSTDIALLKVDAGHPLPAAVFADSDSVRVGDKVLAIGNPLGLGGTVTSGIVSALNRDTQETPYDNFIQTDAAINHGNSGGPLFNLRGEVIGINTSIYSPTETSGSIGLGFALPSDDARFAAEQLRKFGHVRPGWIGARLQQITPDLAQAFGLTSTVGAIVAAVQKSGPAEAAGLRPGDVILAFDDRTPTDVRAMMRMIAESPLGRTSTVTLRRGGADLKVALVIREYPPDEMVADFPFQLSSPPTMASDDAGLRLKPLDATTRARLNLAADASGTEIASVPPASAADRAGLRAGDVILQVQDSPATSSQDVQRALHTAQTEGREQLGVLVMDLSGLHWVALPITAQRSR